MVDKAAKQHKENSMKQTGHIDIDGFKLRYLTEGEGPDALVIGSSVYYPRSFSQNLRQFLRLHFVDYRGFAEGPEVELTFETLLNDLEHIRQKLGLKKCIVIGHSAHGLLALEYAKKYKEYVSHVVIIGMPPHMKPDHIAMAQRNWDDSVWPERKAAFERNMEDIAEYGQALLLTSDGGGDRAEMFKQFTDMFEPNGVVDIAFKTDIDFRAHLISSEKEKKAALNFRQKHFFDQRGFKDPYAWTLDQKDHLHWLLYDGDKVIGYAHVQIWPEHRAALRIIVIDEQKRGSGMGKYLMDCCERELRKQGISLLQTEASPNAYLFYKKLGYIEIPFNNPDGEPTHPDDRAMGKYL